MGEDGNHPSHFTKRIISLISCFGGGIFLATCLLDLLPDSINSIKSAERRLGHTIKFPLPAFCVSIGFLVVLILEQV
jgi:solute carrier family 39 (zinc transporter), member 1/2/3